MDQSRKYTSIITVLISLILFGMSCGVGNKIRSGEQAFERKQFAIAVDLLTQEYDATRSRQDQARKAYLLGRSYMMIGETNEAVKWLQDGYDKGYGPEVTQALAYGYKKMGNYKAAIGKFEDLKRQVSGRDQEINREISVCKQIALWSPDEKYTYKTKLIKASSPDMDYSATIFEDDFLVFTSDRQESTGGEVYNWSGGYHSDLYIVGKNSSSPQRFDALLNSEHNEGAACFSTDDNEIYFTRCFSEQDDIDAFCKIMYSERYTGVWTEPVELNFTVPGFNYGQPTLIEKDSVLIFSSTLEGSIGKHDLFYTEKIPTEEGGHYWAEPAPMPASINTQGDELFPVGDGDTLYFSSDYLPGYGGLDIFKTYLRPNGSWSPPENMLKPINSSEDDYSFVVDRAALLRGSTVEKGFFTSSRKGYGLDDIYQYDKIANEPPTDTVVADPALDKSKYILTLAIKTRTQKLADATDPNSEKLGYEPLAKVSVLLSDGKSQKTLTSDDKGIILVPVEEGIVYTLKGSKSGYFNASTRVNTKNITYPTDKFSITFNAALTLDKIYYNQEIVLDNIYYDFNKWNIREDAKPVLDTLSMLLKDNPQISIELSSHTDCRGDDEYNMILSQKRAQAAVDYIITRGIRPRTINAKGYGETSFVNNCDCDNCSDEDHQQNRRTSFRILE